MINMPKISTLKVPVAPKPISGEGAVRMSGGQTPRGVFRDPVKFPSDTVVGHWTAK